MDTEPRGFPPVVTARQRGLSRAQLWTIIVAAIFFLIVIIGHLVGPAPAVTTNCPTPAVTTSTPAP
jgi:hypothetical protein